MRFWLITSGIELLLLALIGLWYWGVRDDLEDRVFVATLGYLLLAASVGFDVVVAVVRWIR